MFPIARTIAALIACCLVAVGCGGSEDSAQPKDKPASFEKAGQLDRTGYFTATQSELLNPPLAAQHKVAMRAQASIERCNKQQVARSKAGDAKGAAACWIKVARESSQALGAMVKALDQAAAGEYRKSCAEQTEQTRKFFAQHKAKWDVVLKDWLNFSKGKYATGKQFQDHFDAAYAQQDETAERAAQLAKACYIAEDLASPNEDPAKASK